MKLCKYVLRYFTEDTRKIVKLGTCYLQTIPNRKTNSLNNLDGILMAA